MGLTTSNDQQLQLLLGFISESVNSKIQINSKLLRDMFDVVEGLMRGALNSKGNYNHSTLKLNCSFISLKAKQLKMQKSASNLLKLTHREHAIPMKVLVEKLYIFENIKIPELKFFLDQNLVSVLITKSEQKLLDARENQIKDTMPLNWNGLDIFAKFKKLEIEIIKRV